MTRGWATVRRAAGDRRSGAAEIARTAAAGLGELDPLQVEAALQLLLAGHPAMAPLWRLATDVLGAQEPSRGVRRFLKRLETDPAAGASLAPALPPSVVTLSYSSSVVTALRKASGVRLVTCMESRPGGEGRRMAEALNAEEIPAIVIGDDEALGALPGEAVVVGADAVTPWTVTNKVKTRALAEVAAVAGLPCYAVAGETKFVARDLPLEALLERTPLELFTAIATPWGLLTVEEASMQAQLGTVDPRLEALSRGRPPTRRGRAGRRSPGSALR